MTLVDTAAETDTDTAAETDTATPAETFAFPAPDLSPAALAEVTAGIAALAPRYDASGEVPAESLAIVHRAGLLTATVAPEFGGPGLGAAEVTRILVALGEGDASVALLVANSLAAHVGQTGPRRWPAAAYTDLLRRSLEGPALANTIRAEPDLGAPARGGLPATTATRTVDGWVLRGRKAYATGGTALTHHAVWAVAVEPGGDPERPRVGHLVVPGDAAGISWIPTWDHLGLRASNTHDVVYDDVAAPADAFIEIPRAASGAYVDPADARAGGGSLGHTALYVGIARAARRAFVAYARERVPAALGRPIATTERIQAVAGEIDLQIATAEAILFAATARAVAGDDLSGVAAVWKVQAVRAAITAVQTASAALGNPGLTRSLPFERLLRDVLCARVHPPQEDAALIAAGRRVLGQ